MYTTAQKFAKALRQIEKPAGKQLHFLQHHSEAAGRALTATMLGSSVEYKSYRAINLHYGKLAILIGNELGITDPGLGLLCEFIKPNVLTNREWILIMRSEFAEGLRRAKWIV
jgi:hypothetical protein